MDGRSLTDRRVVAETHRESAWVRVGRLANAFALAVLYVFGIGFLLVYLWLPTWLEEGFVDMPPAGKALELRGAPGDQIKLRLLQRDSEMRDRAFYAALGDPESGFQVTVPVGRFDVKESEESEESFALYGWLTVPIPDRPATVLTGTLWGNVRLKGGESASLEVPLRVTVLVPGDGHPSGFKDRPTVHSVLWSVLGIGLLAAVVLTPFLYAEAESERRAASVEDDRRPLQ